ncbi:glutamine synthetase family protein [Streptomyces physcomitrii]|uniref:glutamine synthetase family protein n=1 Tax=Streptomyces physcomitrii TaxID=2724184 RepID=UPI0033E178DF
MYTRKWSRPAAEDGVGRSDFVAEHGLWDERQRAAAAEIEAHLGEVDLIRLVFGDPHGLARSKTLTVEAFRAALRGGMDYSPGPFLFDTGHAVAVDFLSDPGVDVPELLGAGNFVVVPDPVTFQLLPGGEARTAWVIGEEYLPDGRPHPLSSRHVLRKVIAAYAAQEYTPVLGLEVEWYLTRRLEGPVGNAGNGFGLQGEAPRVAAMNPGYQFNSDNAFASVAAFAHPLSALLRQLGLPLRSMEHESGPGQIETTFAPMHALDTADAMLLFRTLVKQRAAQGGYHATFMSLPRVDGFDPSGWHVHQSVVDTRTGRNLFAPDDPAAAPLSAAGLAYAEGLLRRARELCLLSVPTVNGHRRLGSGFSLSPTRIGWSPEDRTAMVRVVGAGGSRHLENRTGEPCANPYLALAAQLFAGLEGMNSDSLVPRPALGPDAAGAETLPGSLDESLSAFRQGSPADLLGTPLARCLAKLKQSELDRFRTWAEKEQPPEGEVTEWEQREYFEAF